MKRTKENSEHYKWGLNCDGWHLLKSNRLSIIEERMPPNTSETLHYHKYAQQFFRILKGIASFEIDSSIIEISTGESMYIPANTKHRVYNTRDEDLELILISEPSTKDDRYEL